MKTRKGLRFAWTLALAIVALCAISSVEIYYATGPLGLDTCRNHLIRIALGTVLFVLLSYFPVRKIMSIIYFIYGFSLIVLIFVLTFGREINSSKSWIGFGGMVFQPSETVKLVVILVLAKYLSDLTEPYLGLFSFAKAAALMLLPLGLIFLQHDLGTAITFIPVFVAIIVLAGVRKRVIFALTVLTMFSALLGWNLLLQHYQKERIRNIIDMERDPQKIGYQTIQSVIAIGSGGMTGKGLGRGSQGIMGFLPEHHTDFIFSMVGEELGFVGAGLVFYLYGLIVYQGIRISSQTHDRQTMYAAFGISILYAFHFISNVGMTLGVAPVIGIPLPPLSYGGSSTVTFFAAMGLLHNFHRHLDPV